MDEGALGFIMLLVLSTISAVGWFGIAKNFFVAAALSAVTASVAFQVAVYLREGYLDPFFPIGLVVGSLYAFVVSIAVGLSPIIFRRLKGKFK